MDLNKLWQEYKETLSSQTFVENELDYSILTKHITQLNNLDRFEVGAYSIFDIFKQDHVYYSRKYETIFKYDFTRLKKEGIFYTNELIHPEDLIALIEAGIYFLKLSMSVSQSIRKNYKLVNEFRMKIGPEKWMKVIEQHLILESDKHGNIWLSLSILDISPEQQMDLPARSRLLNIKTGELFLFPPENKTEIEKPILSIREKEILQMIAKGLISKQIADKLFISVNTVNTHRQRIIEKLGVSNTFEAIRHAINEGLI